jgi:hypothetical protein
VTAVTKGMLPPGLPFLRLGQGPALVMAPGGAAGHANLAAERRISLSTAARFAGLFTVYVTSRKPGLAPGATMADIAADYAQAIRAGHRPWWPGRWHPDPGAIRPARWPGWRIPWSRTTQPTC